MRNQHLGRRVEQLESRCLLSLAGLGNHFEADNRLTIDVQRISAGLAIELLTPQLDLPFQAVPQSMPMVPGRGMPNGALPDAGGPSHEGIGNEGIGGDLDSFVPPSDTDPDKEMMPDGGGQIDLGGYGDSGGSTPADVRGERESRAVLQMLAQLKYPVSVAAAASDGELADPAPVTSNSSVRLDEGAVDIAVSELADELPPAAPRSRSTADSLLDVDVQIDRSAGRFQAFEVLMIDPAGGRQEVREPVRESNTVPAATTNDFGWSDAPQSDISAESASVGLQVGHLHANDQQAIAAEEASPLAFLYALVDEKLSSSWNRAFGFVTFGLVAYIFRVQYRSRSQITAEDSAANSEPIGPMRHSGWFARYFKFASRRRAAASS